MKKKKKSMMTAWEKQKQASKDLNPKTLHEEEEEVSDDSMGKTKASKQRP
jgi:hypothetical protein